MNKLTETQHYIIYKEYESVILEIKNNHRMVQIGDFYGDAQMAVISEDESFCAMCGCGVIIYYLREPFKEYEYHTRTEQWKEWGRNKEGAEIWVDGIRCIGHNTIEIITEDGDIYKIDVYH